MVNKTYRKIVNAWCMYDWANSAFATTIMAAVLPIFYSTVAASTLSPDPEQARVLATSYWGYTASIALLIVAILSPILGAIADYTGAKKRFLALFCLGGALFTSLLIFISTGDWLLCSLFFIVAEIGFSGGNVFYDSLLPHVATRGDIDQVSTKGFALGYLGGGLLLAVNMVMIQFPQFFFIPSKELATRLAFLTVGIWWAVFAIPLFRRVPEPKRPDVGERINPVVAGFGRLIKTFREMRRYRQLLLFLIAFWVYADGIGTIIKMSTIYGTEIGIGTAALLGALLWVQIIGVPCSFLFGWLAKRTGTKPAIYLGLAIYTLISIGGFFMQVAWHFWVLATLVGLVQGGTQALSRSLFASMCPKAKTGEFFGFYSVSSKLAGVAGPFIFALVGQLTGTGRWGILSLVVFFIVGALLLALIKPEEGIRAAREEDAATGM
ncbi:MAG: MFS transporter [Anaerolineales bacterium]|nr:MFS transporter [Anaerolineales bacterium]